MTFLFISYSEIFVIIFVMLLIFGPDKMPEIARNLGKGIRQLRDATGGVKKEILKETQKAGIDTEAVDKLKKQIKDSKKIMNIKEELNPISQIKDEITNTIKRS
jgi:sec-independent protein translocase protein TatA